MSFILIDKPRPDVAVVTMNRPERMNAMAFDVMIPLREALESLSHDNDVRVVVLTGAGHGFCSGADLEDSGIVPNIDGLTASELGISYLLPREVGSARAFDIMLTGRDVDAAEAERIGLVSRVVPGDTLLDECYVLAERIIGFSRVGVEVTKRMLWSSL